MAIAISCVALAPGNATAQLPPLLPAPPSQGTGQAPAAPTNPAPAGQPGSTGVAVNPQRTGYLDDPNLVTPLRRRWSRALPVVVATVYGDGLVFSSMGNNDVVALDPATGRTVWRRPGVGGARDGLAYDHGVLVARSGNRLLALSARTGAPRWSQQTGREIVPTGPLVANGIAYTSDDDAVYAFALTNGALLWKDDGVGTPETLATDGPRVYGSYACGLTFAWNARTGERVWKTTPSCSGGGGSTPVVAGDRLYVAESNAVHDAATGRITGSFRGGEPIVAGGLGLFPEDQALRAADRATGRVAWQLRGLSRGSGSSTHGRSIAVGHTVYAFGQGNRLFAHALETGRREQVLPLQISRDQTDPESAMASAPGLLLVPTGRRLTAYESVYRPAANGIAAGPTVADVELGKRAAIAGVIGPNLRAARRIRLEAAPQGAKRYRSLGSLPSAIDGFFGATITLTRNARVRGVVGRTRSAPVSFYVYPRYRNVLRRARGNPNRIRAAVTVKAPSATRLSGRRIVLYNGRPRLKRYVRLGTARLHRAGRGRSRATVSFGAIRRVFKSDFLVYCVPHASRLGLGRADVLDRRCGRARIPLR